ncbi:hypothetical protein [Nitrosopumilus sp. S4]
MKTCQVCVSPFVTGKKEFCSNQCYHDNLQARLDECFRNDTSHTKLLSSLV